MHFSSHDTDNGSKEMVEQQPADFKEEELPHLLTQYWQYCTQELDTALVIIIFIH